MQPIYALPLALCLTLSPALAQEDRNQMREGMDKLAEGTRLFFEGLAQEFEPALRELEGFVDDLNAYHPPEVLPNGDIIIRRKVPRPVTPEPPREGEIDL